MYIQHIRVVEQVTGEVLPDNFQSAEFQLKNGFIDDIVPRQEQRAYLANILANPIIAPGSDMIISPSIAKLAVAPPIVGSVVHTTYKSSRAGYR